MDTRHYNVVKEHSLFFYKDGNIVESITVKATGHRMERIVMYIQDLVKDDIKVSSERFKE